MLPSRDDSVYKHIVRVEKAAAWTAWGDHVCKLVARTP
jgi:hypothetical protein